MLVRYFSSIVITRSYINTLKLALGPSLTAYRGDCFNNDLDYNVKRKFCVYTFNYYKHKENSVNLLTSKQDSIVDVNKENIIQKLNLQCSDDAAPFYNIPLKTLQQIYKTTQKDQRNGCCDNRLYYISSKLKCKPATLSKHIVKRTFLYKLSFDWLESSLNVLLDFNVSGDRIVRDLWVLKYHHKTIEERLLRVRNCGIDYLYPWMVRCSEDILSRFVQISQETKSILGEYKTTKAYLAKRLGTSPEAIEDIYLKIPALKTIRVVKAKKFLDFLISEGFHIEEIVIKPRIFSASQNTVKQRLEKLRKLGLTKINLNVLCRSRKDFQKYCESIEAISKK